MTFRAIHKPTGKLVEARKLESDPIWKSKINDEWIYDIGIIPLDIKRQLDKKGITELKVSFIKSHSRKEERVRAHFRKENIEGINLDNLENESEEHKLCKEGIYYELIDDKLLIDFGEKVASKISKLCSDYECHIEERLSNERGSKIGDVVVTFDKEHPLLGKGIVFEIQFSGQALSKTIVRTNDRVLGGYSVSWLWVGNFDDSNKLLDNKIKVITFRTAIKKYDELFEEGILSNYEFIRNDIEQKIEELESKKQDMYSEITKSINIIDGEVEKRTKEFYKEFSDIVNKQIKTFHPNTLETIYRYTDNVLKEIDINSEISKLLEGKVNLSVDNLITNFKNESINPKLNLLDNEMNNILSETKTKYNSLLSEKIKGLLEDKNEDFIKNSFEEAIKNVQEDIADKIRKKLDLTKCEGCGLKFPFNDIHWQSGSTYPVLCRGCWNKTYDKDNNKIGGEDEKEESKGLERFSG